MIVHDIYTSNQVSKVLGNLSRITLPFCTVCYCYALLCSTMNCYNSQTFREVNEYLKCLEKTKMPPKLNHCSMCMQSATDTARIQLEYTLDTDDAQSQDNCTKMTTSAALLHSTEDGKVLDRRKTMEDGGVDTAIKESHQHKMG